MAAIIGRARASQTPVFTASMTSIAMNPSWHVPNSIARAEILPKLATDPDYLARNHMEMSRAPDSLRIRQLPGPWNALGSLKFDMPNVHGVYLHGTPAVELFARTRRDFSHGCIRLEDPIALAEWLLRGQAEWNRARILAAIDTGDTRVVNIVNPPRVVLFYMTAAFVPEEGVVRFADDIYGHDARLDAWLQARTGDGE